MTRPITAALPAALIAAALCLGAPAAASAAEGVCVWNAIGPAEQQKALEGYKVKGVETLLSALDRPTVLAAATRCGGGTDEGRRQAIMRFAGYAGSLGDMEVLAQGGITAAQLHGAWVALPAADRDLVQRLTMGEEGDFTAAEKARGEAAVQQFAKAIGAEPGTPARKAMVTYLAHRFLSTEPL